MSDFLKSVEDYFVLIGPSLVAVISCIASIITAIKRCKDVTKGTLSKVESLEKELKGLTQSLATITSENKDLRVKLAEICNLNTDNINYILEQLKCENELNLGLKQQIDQTQKLLKEVDLVKRQLKTVAKNVER